MKPINNLDLNLLPLVRRAGQDQSSLPGLYAVNPPRRAARGRDGDQLVLYLSSSAPWGSDQQTQLLAHTAQVYYDTTGAVTSAARAAIESLNQYLLDRNLRGGDSHRQGAGWFTLVAVRAGHVYLAQAGRMRTFLLTPQGSQELSDSESSGPGLGVARPPTLRYFQADMAPENYLLLTPVLPPNWQQNTLQGIYSQGLESIRRRLLAQAGTDLAAVLIQAQAGEGKMRLLWPKASQVKPVEKVEPSAASPAVQPPPAVPVPVEPVPVVAQPAPESLELGEAAPPLPEILPELPTETPPAFDEAVIPIEAASRPAASESTVPIPDSTPFIPLPSEPIPARRLNDQPAPRTSRPSESRTSQAAAKVKAVTKTALGAFGRAVKTTLLTAGRFLKRILPDESVFNLPPSVMIFLAVAVPVMVAVVAVTIFVNRGLKEQAQVHLAEAITLAQQARSQPDPALQRATWEETLSKAKQAEINDRENTDIQALQIEANTALDQLNKIKRLLYQPALTDPLNQSLNVIQIVATQDELYLLTDAQGSVSRALQTGSGYKLDVSFNCGPGMYGTRAVGRLVDVLALPPGSEFNATLLGMDSSANLLYCLPHERPKAISMATPTTSGWGSTAHFALDQDTKNLYVLDPVKRNVWIYEGLSVNEQPIAFFDPSIDTIPNLDNIVDMAVNRATIYLLHANGETTLCEFGRVAGNPNRCQSPIPYQDDRPGLQTGTTIDGAFFNALYYVQPPDPSIFMLNPETQAIYQFGLLQLNFYYQYRPQLTDNPIPAKPATAFGVSPNRTAFLAVGSQVFQAQIIP
jgi:hypothetical protein